MSRNCKIKRTYPAPWNVAHRLFHDLSQVGLTSSEVEVNFKSSFQKVKTDGVPKMGNPPPPPPLRRYDTFGVALDIKPPKDVEYPEPPPILDYFPKNPWLVIVACSIVFTAIVVCMVLLN